MFESKLTTKSLTRLPKGVRDFLRLQKFDEIEYRIEDGRVYIAKVQGAGRFETWTEWNDEADSRAFRDL